MNRTLFLSTLIALALSLAMTVLSAHIRLSDSGIDCSPWPECFASSYKIDDQPGISIHQEDPNKGVRMLHRMLASTFGLLVLFQFSVAVWYRKTQATGLLLPTVILALTIVLAVVGMNTPDILHPIITLVNLAGGMTLSACLYWYLLGFYPASTGKPITLITLISVSLAILSGAWVSGNFAAGACETVCSWQGNLGAAFDPGRTLDLTDEGLRIDHQQQIILLAHQLLAFISFALLIFVAALLRPFTRSALLLGATFGFGAIIVSEHFGQSVWLASTHNGLALIIPLLLIHQYRRWDSS
jgi:heme A synthase